MPFRGFDDLRQLIEEKMPRQLREALAHGNARPKRYLDVMLCDRPETFVLDNADNIVWAMKDEQYQACAEDCGEINEIVLPRFRLRH
jgi:hypothetical protein